jgi:hypothetical protein
MIQMGVVADSDDDASVDKFEDSNPIHIHK